jgi:hypothetical protein
MPPADPYTTQLKPDEEVQFQAWAKRNGVRMEPGWNEDYDMRGLWKSNPNIVADPRGHWPDTYKKPNHPTFSNESIYATPDAPRWVGNKLIDNTGRVVADESPIALLGALDATGVKTALPPSRTGLGLIFDWLNSRLGGAQSAVGMGLAAPSVTATPPVNRPNNLVQ